jgi:hypothetical protein
MARSPRAAIRSGVRDPGWPTRRSRQSAVGDAHQKRGWQDRRLRSLALRRPIRPLRPVNGERRSASIGVRLTSIVEAAPSSRGMLSLGRRGALMMSSQNTVLVVDQGGRIVRRDFLAGHLVLVGTVCGPGPVPPASSSSDNASPGEQGLRRAERRHDNWTRYARAATRGATTHSRFSLPSQSPQAQCRGFETRLPLHFPIS